jgi:RNA polymerase sigma-70 factor (ECF subfamily)
MMSELTIAGATVEAVPQREAPLDFAALVREHQSMVFSIAYSCLRDRATSEEIAQDVFLELHRALPTLESRSHITHWLRRVAVHRSIDAIRKRKPTIALAAVREPSAPSGEQDFMAQAKIRRLVANLPAQARMAVILRYQEDLPPTQIAEILDIPVQTVKSRIHRSLALLREKLERGQKRK